MEMGGIIDVHAHILPGIDDGAADFDETLHLLRLAARQGVTSIIATPHDSRRVKPERIRELAAEAEARFREECPDFRLYPGQEIYYHEEMAVRLRRGELLTLADSRYVLTEFDPGVSYKTLYIGVRALKTAGYVPVLAHMERYECLREEENLDELSEGGCLFQMNYGSLRGGLFHGEARRCRALVQDGRIHFLGTDLHRSAYRPPEISRALRWMERHVEEELVEKLIRENPRHIINKEGIG